MSLPLNCLQSTLPRTLQFRLSCLQRQLLLIRNHSLHKGIQSVNIIKVRIRRRKVLPTELKFVSLKIWLVFSRHRNLSFSRRSIRHTRTLTMALFWMQDLNTFLLRLENNKLTTKTKRRLCSLRGQHLKKLNLRAECQSPMKHSTWNQLGIRSRVSKNWTRTWVQTESPCNRGIWVKLKMTQLRHLKPIELSTHWKILQRGLKTELILTITRRSLPMHLLPSTLRWSLWIKRFQGYVQWET